MENQAEILATEELADDPRKRPAEEPPNENEAKRTKTTEQVQRTTVGNATFLIIGDTHISGNRKSDALKLRERLTKMISNPGMHKKTDAIIFNGDIRHTYGMWAQEFIEDWFIELSKFILVIVNVGNHDRPDHNQFCNDRHGYHALGKIDNICVVDYPKFFTIRGSRIFIVPYVPEGRLMEAIQLIDPDLTEIRKCVCGFLHNTIRGVKDHRTTNTTGDVWPIDFPTVFVGHWHNFHIPQANVIFHGSPYQVSRDEPEDKFFIYLRLAPEPNAPMLPIQKAFKAVEVEFIDEAATHALARNIQFQRFLTKMPVCRTLSLTAEKFAGYVHEPQENVHTWILNISGPEQEINDVCTTKHYRDLSKITSIRIFLRPDNPGPVTKSHSKHSFMDVLTHRAAEQGLQKILAKILKK